jgi:hypothetical protein
LATGDIIEALRWHLEAAGISIDGVSASMRGAIG